MKITPNNQYPKHFDEKYKGIPYLILDIPKIVPDSNFKELWNENKVPIVRVKPDERYPFKNAQDAEEHHKIHGGVNQYTTANWEGFLALTRGNTDDRWSNSVVDGHSLLPDFFLQLYEYLPIRYLAQVLFWSNNIAIGLHRDLNEQYSWPSSLRMMIEDNNPQSTFFLTPADEAIFNGKSKPIPKDIRSQPTAKFVNTLNSESNTFVYNNKEWAHGALKETPDRKILCAIGIAWDFEKLEVLLDQSIAKYGNNLP